MKTILQGMVMMGVALGIVAVLLSAGWIVVREAGAGVPCPTVDMHPVISAEGKDADLKFTASCPKGFQAADPKHLIRPNMTMAESITVLGKLECVKQ